MFLIVFLLLVLVSNALDIHECADEELHGLKLKVCTGLKEYERVQFMDVTGENQIRLKENKIYRNHGEFVALFKTNVLYVAKEKYKVDRWDTLKNKLN